LPDGRSGAVGDRALGLSVPGGRPEDAPPVELIVSVTGGEVAGRASARPTPAPPITGYEMNEKM
jgi:hypothetical protein